MRIAVRSGTFARRKTMPSRWDSKWDDWCYTEAVYPGPGEWWWLVAGLLALVRLIAAGVRIWMVMR